MRGDDHREPPRARGPWGGARARQGGQRKHGPPQTVERDQPRKSDGRSIERDHEITEGESLRTVER